MSCQLAFVLFGYDQGVFGGIVGNENFLNQFGHPDSAFEGIIVSIYNLGAFSGCIVAFFFCERLGRRRAMWVAMAFILVSFARCHSAQSSISDEKLVNRLAPRYKPQLSQSPNL